MRLYSVEKETSIRASVHTGGAGRFGVFGKRKRRERVLFFGGTLDRTAIGKSWQPPYRLTPEELTKNHLSLIFMLPLLAALGMASELPEAPIPSEHASHKLFFAEVGALTAANALDGYTTVRDTNWGYAEESFALGKRPSAAKYVALEGAIEAATVLGAWELKKSHRKTLRMCSHYLMGIETFAHAGGAIHNFRDFSGPLK